VSGAGAIAPALNYKFDKMYKMAKRRFALFIFITHVAIVVVTAQDGKRNLIQLNYSINYFKGHEIESIKNYPTPNFSFTRFSKNQHYFLTVEVDELFIYYNDSFENKGRGTIMERNSIVFGLIGGYNLMISPKQSFLAKFGLAYRAGWETQYLYTLHHQLWSELFSKRYYYHNPGIEVSAKYLIKLSDHWSLNLGGGYQYFFSRATTNHHLRIDGGVGYAF
jgi:hypothetical protein